MRQLYQVAEERLLQQMTRIEAKLNTLIVKHQRKRFVTVSELAGRLDLNSDSVRNWCRTGRIAAVKAQCGHGRSKEWRISDAEVRRIEREGPRPVQKKSTTDVVLLTR
jgi:Helix-turn-helix domain